MKDKMKKGDPNQDKDINIIKSKNIHHSYAIIETINDIVKDKDTLLKKPTIAATTPPINKMYWFV